MAHNTKGTQSKPFQKPKRTGFWTLFFGKGPFYERKQIEKLFTLVLVLGWGAVAPAAPPVAPSLESICDCVDSSEP